MDARTDDGLDPRLESLLEHVEWSRKLAGRLVADAARADDVVQSALAAAAKSPPRDATNLRGWLGEVVRNVARGIGREEGRRDERERAAAKPEAIEGTDELVARAEMSRDLAQHVLALDVIYRDVVLMRWYEGLAPRQIARKLGVPVATVNTRLARAHRELHARLDRAYGDRATWCVAFAPSALMPKAAVPAGIVAVLAVLFLASIAITALRLARPERPFPSVVDSMGHPMVVGDDGSNRVLELPLRNGSAVGEIERVSSDARRAGATSMASAASSSLDTLHVEGHAIGFDGLGIGGLELRARDPSLPRIADGWLHVGNRGSTVDERQMFEWKQFPQALEETLAHHGNPPGLREVLLGADLSASTTTGADGGFVLDVPGSNASLETPDDKWFLVATGRCESIDGDILLVAPAVRVAGTIVDDKGVPVAKSRLLAEGEDAAISRMPSAFERAGYFARFEEIVSDEHGRFDMGRVATYPGARLMAAVETQYAVDVEMPTSDVSDLVLVARIRPTLPKPRVRGVVLDERGIGIVGASVRLSGNVTQTDANGRFELEEENFQPESELVAIKPGLAPGWIAGIGKELRDKRLLDNVEIRLNGKALAITGRAVDAQGRALEDWIVSLADAVKYPTMGIPLEFAAAGWYGNEQQPETDDEGRFRVEGLAPQPYRVRLTDHETGVVFDSDPILAGARDVEVRLPADVLRPEIRGRTVSKLGVPVAGVEIEVIYVIREQRGSTTWKSAQSTRSDSDGEFELEDVPRRGLKLSVGGKKVRPETIVVPDDVDPKDVVVTVTVERRFQLEVDAAEQIDQFEILDRSGKALSIDGQFAHALSALTRMQLDGDEFPVCTVSEEGVTIVLYRKDVEVRRAPISWTGERTQIVRP